MIIFKLTGAQSYTFYITIDLGQVQLMSH